MSASESDTGVYMLTTVPTSALPALKASPVLAALTPAARIVDDT